MLLATSGVGPSDWTGRLVSGRDLRDDGGAVAIRRGRADREGAGSWSNDA